jgi:hypothetical protein
MSRRTEWESKIQNCCFAPFQQNAKSSGLGLCLSRALLRSFGGDLRYETAASEELYDSLLKDIGCNNPNIWGKLRLVLKVLALAGVGPSLPLALLRKASGELGGPQQTFELRNALAKIRPLIVRNAAGTEDERCGIFHQTFVDYLADRFAKQGITAVAAHAAIVVAIDELAPSREHQRMKTNPLYRYAYASELDHLWGSGQFERLVDSSDLRRSPNPVDALAQWQMWPDKMAEVLGHNHEHAIGARTMTAQLLGEAGNTGEALQRLEREQYTSGSALGPDHPMTLQVRGSVCYSIAEQGRFADALMLAKSLFADTQRVLGHYHPKTLATKSNIAFWTGEVHGAREAIPLCEGLLIEQEHMAADPKCSWMS